MTAVTTTQGLGTMYWWDSHGNEGQWVATAVFANAWQRGSYLTIKVKRVWGAGNTTTETVKEM